MLYAQNALRGAVLVMASELMFASMGAAVKAASSALPNEVVVFFRNFFGLLALAPWLMQTGIGELRTEVLSLHLLRSAVGLGAMYCFFYSISHLRLAEAVLVALASPFCIPVIAAAWLGEEVPRRARLAIPLGFLGVALILKPGSGVFAWAGVVGLAGAGLAALAKVTIRRMSQTEPTARIVFYFAVVATAASAVPLAWVWRTPTPRLWWMLAASGLFATAGQLLLTRAYAVAPAARIGPVTYVAVLFSSVYGWLLWGEKLGVYSLAGAVVICCAGVLTMTARVEQRSRTSVPEGPSLEGAAVRGAAAD
jgi:drug/metabolite transporter (DMT)-like permease